MLPGHPKMGFPYTPFLTVLAFSDSISPILSLILFFLILFLYLSLTYRGEHCHSSRADLVVRLSYTQVNQHQLILIVTHTQTSSVHRSTPININHHTHKQVLDIYQSPLLSFIHSPLEGPQQA